MKRLKKTNRDNNKNIPIDHLDKLDSITHENVKLSILLKKFLLIEHLEKKVMI